MTPHFYGAVRNATDTQVIVNGKSFGDLVALISNAPTVELRRTERDTKLACPMFAAGIFREPIRENENIEVLTALVGDYDEGQIAIEVAAEIIKAQGIRAFLYETPSCKPDAPRWRVIAELSGPVGKSKYDVLLGKLNSLFKAHGSLGNESWNVRFYFFGKVEGKRSEGIDLPGVPFDQLPNLVDLEDIRPEFQNAIQDNGGRPLSVQQCIDEAEKRLSDGRGKYLPGARTDALLQYLVAVRREDLTADTEEEVAKRAAQFGESYIEPRDLKQEARLSHWAFDEVEYGPRARTGEQVREAFNDREGSDPTRLTRADRELLGLPVAIRQAIQGENHDAIALAFRARYQGQLLFSTAHNKWFEYDGARWKIDRTSRAFHYAREICRENQDPSKPKSTVASAGFAGGVEAFCRADPDLNTDGSDWDADNYLLNTPSGTIDLRTNTLREANPDDRITLTTSVGPEQGEPVAFLRFLDEITVGDTEVQEFLQVSLGACLSGAIESHWMMFWVGSGRNGKNTLGDLVQEILGGYSKKIPSDVLMAKRQQGHPTEIANLQGTRLAVASEVDEGSFWDEARINEVTGDRELSARYMRQDLFTFKRTHKHLVYGNHRPQLRSISGGIRSRLKIVPFKASFVGREDLDLPTKLKSESGMVLAWLLEGHRKWLAGSKKLPACSAVDTETNEYFASQSTVELWITERLKVVNDDGRSGRGWLKASDLFDDYTQWKVSRGEKPLGQQRWGEKMKEKFVQVTAAGIRYVGLEKLPIDKWG